MGWFCICGSQNSFNSSAHVLDHNCVTNLSLFLVQYCKRPPLEIEAVTTCRLKLQQLFQESHLLFAAISSDPRKLG